MDKAPDIGGPAELLVRAISRLLRPLVRALIAHGITFPMISEILKRLYVRSAAEDFPIARSAGQPVSDSRISLLTRVHRKDVKRLRQHSDRPPAASGADSSLVAQLIAKWLASPDYTDKDGNPTLLARTESGGETPSFNGLVTSISKDVRPRVILDELVNREIVTIGPDDRIRLNKKAFVPRKDFENMTFFYGHNLHDHMAAATSNLLQENTPFLERSVYYHNLTPASVDILRKESGETGMDALLALNKRAHALAEQDKGKKSANQRMTFGVYFYKADMEGADDV